MENFWTSRRVWAAVAAFIVGLWAMLSALLEIFGVKLPIPSISADALTNILIAVATTVSTVLGMLSFFKPKPK